MYAIGINDDNNISTLISQQICEGYRLSDWFWIFVKPYYNGHEMQKYDASIEFILPKSKNLIVEQLIFKNEKHHDDLKYALSSKSKFTKEPGVVEAKIIFSDTKGVIIRETSDFSVKISISGKWHNDVQNSINSPDNNNPENGCGCNLEEHMEQILSKTKPLVFNSLSDAEDKLNSGEIKNVYFGQPVIINKDGKYISYTVQKSGSGYTVEPVDTICDGSSLIWQED